MYGWGVGVCMLGWCLKKRDILSLLRKMHTPHPPPG
jgi:hypothetical protein